MKTYKFTYIQDYSPNKRTMEIEAESKFEAVEKFNEKTSHSKSTNIILIE